jgi:hypothetical protein
MRGHKALFGVAILAVFGALPQAAVAGPPLICHAIQIGQAKSLPWVGEGWRLSGKGNYDISRLVDDTLSLLGPDMPVIVRMETLRRATLYAQNDPAVAKRLLFTLRSRALDSDAKGRPDALAWFDYGYLAECYKQTAWMPGSHGEGSNASALAANFDGYAAVEKAISLRGGAEDEPQMEFAAALIGLEGDKRGQHAHAQKAADAAGKGQDRLLAENLYKVPFLDKQNVATALMKTPTKN